MLNVLLVCGMSGAGKTTAQNILEDMGYMCIDNMPPVFISSVVDIAKKKNEATEEKIGFIFDVKYHSVGKILKEYLKIKELEDPNSFQLRLVFLDASDEVLLGRYRETRRKHPFANDNTTLAEAIKKEHQLLQDIKNIADIVLDTTDLSAKELSVRFRSLFGDVKQSTVFNITFKSFGFKHGIPRDADFVLDVRFLPNPFYDMIMRLETGQDKRVYDFVLNSDEGQKMLNKTIDYLEYLLDEYQNDRRNNFIVAVGCTGGQHRSVAIIEALYTHFKEIYICFVQHRDMEANQLEIKKRYQFEK